MSSHTPRSTSPNPVLDAPASAHPAAEAVLNPRTIPRRALLGGGLGLGALLTLAACTPADTTAVASPSAPRRAASCGTSSRRPGRRCSHRSRRFYPNGGIVNNITDRLLYQDEEYLDLHPWIAEDLPEVNEDATEFVFRIRDGVTYSDGSPLDAANVAKNFDLFGLGDNARGLPISEQITNYRQRGRRRPHGRLPLRRLPRRASRRPRRR